MIFKRNVDKSKKNDKIFSEVNYGKTIYEEGWFKKEQRIFY